MNILCEFFFCTTVTSFFEETQWRKKKSERTNLSNHLRVEKARIGGEREREFAIDIPRSEKGNKKRLTLRGTYLHLLYRPFQDSNPFVGHLCVNESTKKPNVYCKPYFLNVFLPLEIPFHHTSAKITLNQPPRYHCIESMSFAGY